MSDLQDIPEEFDRRQLLSFEGILRNILEQRPKCAPVNICRKLKDQEQAPYEEKTIVNEKSDVLVQATTERKVSKIVCKDARSACVTVLAALSESCAVSTPPAKTSA